MKHIFKRTATGLLMAGVLALTAGCGSVTPERYASETPKLDLAQYFNGPVQGWGLFQDRSGEVVKRFTVKMNCTWNGDVGTLKEDFLYSDGTRQQRVWTMKKNGDRYIGSASDVVGDAIGQAAGNAVNFKYTFVLPVDGSTYHVQMDDWLYQVDEKVVMNRAAMSKFGVYLGQVILSFRKQP